MLAIETAKFWNRGIPIFFLKITHNDLIFYFSIIFKLTFSAFQCPQNLYLIYFLYEMRFFVGSVVHWGSYGLKQGNPLKKFKSLIKLYFSCLISYGFPFYIESLSKVRYLFIKGKGYVSHWGSYDPQQVNPLWFLIFWYWHVEFKTIVSL